MEFLEGDIILTKQNQGSRLISRAIAWFSRMPGEPKTRATHVGMVVRGGDWQSARLLEALWPRVTISPLSKYRHSIIVYRAVNVPDIIKLQMRIMACRHALPAGGGRGALYGLFKIPLFALDGLLGKLIGWPRLFICRLFGWRHRPLEIRLFTRLNFIWLFVCSQVVARVYSEIAGIDFKHNWMRVTPDDIDDFCRSHPELFEQVYS